jgi:hypothetical protein
MFAGGGARGFCGGAERSSGRKRPQRHKDTKEQGKARGPGLRGERGMVVGGRSKQAADSTRRLGRLGVAIQGRSSSGCSATLSWLTSLCLCAFVAACFGDVARWLGGGRPGAGYALGVGHGWMPPRFLPHSSPPCSASLLWNVGQMNREAGRLGGSGGGGLKSALAGRRC